MELWGLAKMLIVIRLVTLFLRNSPNYLKRGEDNVAGNKNFTRELIFGNSLL